LFYFLCRGVKVSRAVIFIGAPIAGGQQKQAIFTIERFKKRAAACNVTQIREGKENTPLKHKNNKIV
jgi:hypothetical protein